jgi:hypothetical protein
MPPNRSRSRRRTRSVGKRRYASTDILWGVRQFRQAWKAAIDTRDVDAMVKLYDTTRSSSVSDTPWLLGTMDSASTPPRRTLEDVRAYFGAFFSNNSSLRVRFAKEVEMPDCMIINPTTVVYAGYYAFDVVNAHRARETGTNQTLNAKFLFILRRCRARSDDSHISPYVIQTHISGTVPIDMP